MTLRSWPLVRPVTSARWFGGREQKSSGFCFISDVGERSLRSVRWSTAPCPLPHKRRFFLGNKKDILHRLLGGDVFCRYACGKSEVYFEKKSNAAVDGVHSTDAPATGRLSFFVQMEF